MRPAFSGKKCLVDRLYRTRSQKQRMSKCIKIRVTLLFTGNAFGDAKLKPLVIHKSKNPTALKNVRQESLPVIWRHNKRAWMTGVEFVEWFSNHFVPFVSAYNMENNLDNRALLILDNFTGHPTTICNMFPHIKVLFLPPNTTPLTQPMDQGITASFKAIYLKLSMNCLASSMAESVDMKSYWQKFNIKDAVDIIGEAWENVSHSTMTNAWKPLLIPACDSVENANVDSLSAYNNLKTLQLMHEVGLNDVQMDDIDQMTKNEEDEMTNEELLQIEHFLVDDKDTEEFVIHTITCNESQTENSNLTPDLIRQKFFEAVEEFKKWAALLKKKTS